MMLVLTTACLPLLYSSAAVSIFAAPRGHRRVQCCYPEGKADSAQEEVESGLCMMGWSGVN